LQCAQAGLPDRAIIQAAYERVEQTGSKLHDKGLQVIAATCNAGAAKPTGRYLCQVTFLSRDDPNQRLYFDIVAVDQVDGRWELTSGLCKR
jgi:hypothetical protein